MARTLKGNPADLPTSTPEEVADYAAQGVAKEAGLSMDDARTLLAAQAQFGLAVDKLRTRYPDVVSSVAWNNALRQGEVNLVQGATASDVVEAEAIAVDAGAIVKHSGELSEGARSDQAVRLSEAIRAAQPELKNLSVHPSADYSGLVVVSPEPVDVEVDRWVADTGGGAGVKVTIDVQPDMGGSFSGGVVGGAQLNRPNGSAACTSAFTIRISGSTYLLTAGHCDTALNYGNNLWLGLSLPERWGAWGDLQYHWIYNGGVGQPKFQYVPGSLTVNKYPSSPYTNMWVNRFGRNTSETIQVDNPDSTETIESHTMTHVAVTYSETNNIPGDSGGPYWIGASGGASAVGIHSGTIWRYIGPITCCHRAVFTPSANLWNIWPSATYYLG